MMRLAIFTCLMCSYCSAIERTMCQGEYFKKSCREGEVIVFDKVMYGRTNSSICMDDPVTTCVLPAAVAALNRRCFGRQYCEFVVDDVAFGDNPCPGVPKYMEATYGCVPKSTVHVLCQNGWRMHLDGESGGYIMSPDYPKTFPTDLTCYVEMEAKSGSRFDLSFLDLELEPKRGKGCKDYVSIRDLNSNDHSLGHIICGYLDKVHNGESVQKTQVKHLKVDFRSDGNADTFGGFIIKYDLVYDEFNFGHDEL